MLHCRCLGTVLFTSAVLWWYGSGLAGQVPGTTDTPLATEGKLVAIHAESISVKNDYGAFVFHVKSGTQIWRGGTVGLHQLHLGDDVGIVYHAPNAAASRLRRT